MKKIVAATLLYGVLAAQAFAGDTIKIAVTGPFTGGSAPMGASARDGAKLAGADAAVALEGEIGDV